MSTSVATHSSSSSTLPRESSAITTPLSPRSRRDHTEEGLLRDVLDELDRERKRRAELEAQIRFLLTEKQQAEDEFKISRKHYIALQTELQGYRQLVEVMTRDKPAMAAAIKATTRQKIGALQKNGPEKSTSTSNALASYLPLHVVRLLEVMPWDHRTKQYTFATEELYEWQFYDRKQQKWLSELRHCPSFFKTLPTEEPSPGVNAVSDGRDNQRDRTILNFLAGTETMSAALPSQCVLTNHGLTRLYNLKHGYPLPSGSGGTWQWVGGWRIEKRIAMDDDHFSLDVGIVKKARSKQVKVDCDDDGWSYAEEPSHFLINPTELCWDNPGTSTGTSKNPRSHETIKRSVRRRKWTRQRALVDYPFASTQTKEFLRLMAQYACATISANKVSEQLVDTKMALTEAETKLEECKDELAIQGQMLRQVLEAREKEIIVNGDTTATTAGTDPTTGQKDLLKSLTLSVREKFLPSPV